MTAGKARSASGQLTDLLPVSRVRYRCRMQAATPPQDGEHRVYFVDGTLSGIEHNADGVKSGACEYWYRNGQKKAEGQFANGTFTGDWVWWRENGELLQKGAFVDGEQHGFWQRWHDTGALMDEGEWVRGKRSGQWKHYDKAGKLRKTDKYPDRTSD
jgi:antitoxin component YwqK of YwqJK toxin-antitoxin module